MARFRYTGNSDRPQVILGLTFTADGTEVPDEIVARLSGHSHLERVEDGEEIDAPALAKPRGRPPKVRED